ncbi:MAG: hypothetical protein HZC05_01225 [Candidatus Magasanikbacteria bacterium]|nr:hypothetical protein [Candidatus Magasanikbacteria bacterium]
MIKVEIDDFCPSGEGTIVFNPYRTPFAAGHCPVGGKIVEGYLFRIKHPEQIANIEMKCDGCNVSQRFNIQKDRSTV